MEALEVIELMSRGEDSRTQFKQAPISSKALAEEIVAFSNSKGGRILFGVDDRGALVGLSPDQIQQINQGLSDAANDKVRPSVYPESEIVRIEDRLVLVVTVRPGVGRPYADKSGSFWVKSGPDKRRITSREEIQRMLQASSLIHADEVPVEGTTLEAIDSRHFEEFFAQEYGERVEAALQGSGISLTQLLGNLGLAKGETLNLAGLLLFGSRPQRYRPAFVVKAVSFVGTDPAGDHYRDSEDISGCLKEMHIRTISFLTRNLRKVQGERSFNSEGTLEVPLVALEELVVNMLLHRDYFISAPWRVMMFDDRIELISPGALPNNLTIENIRSGVSNIRNPVITSFATKELPYRGIGTGVRRALAAVPDLGLESDRDTNQFTVRIPRTHAP
jgi:ATP-dependent DNA helicase RecG